MTANEDGTSNQQQPNGILNSIGGAASVAGSSIAGTASSAYNAAPDLGVTSTAQAAYQNAPDLGIGRRLGGASGADGEQGSDAAASAPQEAGKQDGAEGGAKIVQEAHEARVQQSRDSGPSNEKRLNKSQSQIGIEDGIPTAAGAGTTLPQDETVQSAFRSGAERHEAKVPQDYEPVDCPTKHAGNKDGKKTVPVGSSSSQSTREQRGQHEDDEEEDGQEQGGKVKGTAQKIKNVVKGDAKIVAGLVTRNEDKKEAGREIKRGAA